MNNDDKSVLEEIKSVLSSKVDEFNSRDEEYRLDIFFNRTFEVFKMIYRNVYNANPFPMATISQDVIANMLCMSKTSVNIAIKELCDNGFLIMVREKTRTVYYMTEKGANSYKILTKKYITSFPNDIYK